MKNRTIIVATNPSLWEPVEFVVEVYHEVQINALDAIRAAAREYIATPEGEAYSHSIYNDFNWGDAITEIPMDIFARHGITAIGPLTVNEWARISAWEHIAEEES